ncbi:MAG: hypothetical protein FWE03_03055 [Firmicutes bacterium]|nr:hypothetical protein [Bacillota bacterium]
MSQANRKFKNKLPYIIIAGVTAALLLLTLILHLVQIRPLEQFMNADRVFVVNGINSAPAVTEGHQAVINEAFEEIRHSALRNMFENSGNHRVRPHAIYNDITNEWDRISHSVAAFGYISPGQNEFMLRLEWNQTQNLDQENPDNNLFFYYRECLEHEGEYNRHFIAFDRMIMIIPAPTADIQRVRLIPYLQFNLNNGRPNIMEEGFNWPDSEGRMSSLVYRAHEFSSYMYVRRFHQILQDADGFRPGGGSGGGSVEDED